jgi:4-carboxymuconolactone decarboxylase
VRDLLGEKGAVELTGLIGYYSLLAMQLNVFRVEPPEGAAIPWW